MPDTEYNLADEMRRAADAIEAFNPFPTHLKGAVNAAEWTQSTNQLNYLGDHTRFDQEHIMGPDMFGAYYRIAEAAYDHRTNNTALTLVPIPPADIRKLAAPKAAEFLVSARIAALFGGSL
jgi:hypothetical protein